MAEDIQVAFLAAEFYVTQPLYTVQPSSSGAWLPLCTSKSNDA